MLPWASSCWDRVSLNAMLAPGGQELTSSSPGPCTAQNTPGPASQHCQEHLESAWPGRHAQESLSVGGGVQRDEMAPAGGRPAGLAPRARTRNCALTFTFRAVCATEGWLFETAPVARAVLGPCRAKQRRNRGSADQLIRPYAHECHTSELHTASSGGCM